MFWVNFKTKIELQLRWWTFYGSSNELLAMIVKSNLIKALGFQWQTWTWVVGNPLQGKQKRYLWSWSYMLIINLLSCNRKKKKKNKKKAKAEKSKTLTVLKKKLYYWKWEIFNDIVEIFNPISHLIQNVVHNTLLIRSRASINPK